MGTFADNEVKTGVEAYKDDTFHIRNTDGRFDYSEDALQEIEQHTFLLRNSQTKQQLKNN